MLDQNPDSPPAAALASIGGSTPLGATLAEGGVNFSLYSRGARGVELLLFDGEDDSRPERVVQLDAGAHRTYHYWHVFVPNLQPGQLYAYRIEGTAEPE